MSVTPTIPAVTPELLSEISRKIVAQFLPEKVILFGSRAWGAPRPDSDVDLLVIMESDLRPAQRSAQISRACRPKFLSMDIIVQTPTEAASRLQKGDAFFRRILEKGTTLYAR